MTDRIEQGRPYVTTAQAAQRSGLTQSYLTLLLRRGTLEGFQLAREWFLYTDSLDSFLARSRKSGPKGPRKPKEET